MRQAGCWLVLGMLACGAGAARADDPVLREAAGLAGPALLLETGAPGLVLVVVRGDETFVGGYGETAKGNGKQPDGRSLIRIGSISKAFAGELLGGLVADGTVRLTDTLAHYAPPGTHVPEAGGRPIALLDLATHTAGLTRDLPDDRATGPDGQETSADRFGYLSTYTLLWPPGSAAAYSNLGFDLLGDAMEKAAGQDYEALLKARIAGPLGMSDTTIAPTPEQCARLMVGTGLTPPTPCVARTGDAASGGVYSTGDDMARWLRHNLRAEDPAADSTLLLTHAVYRQRQSLSTIIGLGGASGICLGWEYEAAAGDTPAMFDKNGATDGFLAQASIAPGRGVGVFIAINKLDFGAIHFLSEAAQAFVTALAVR